MEFKHEFFGSNPYGTWPPSEDLDARIATALRHMAAKVGRTGGASPEQRQSRQRALRRLNYLAAQGIDIRQGCTMDLGADLGEFSEEAVCRGANLVAVGTLFVKSVNIPAGVHTSFSSCSIHVLEADGVSMRGGGLIEEDLSW